MTTPVPLVHLPVSLAGPEPFGSTSPSRRCRGCFPPSPASPGSGCPQLRYAAATAQRRRSFTSARKHSASWRTRSPSQKPGTARSSASAGRSLMLTMSGIFPLLTEALDRGTRFARPCRNASFSSVRSSPFACRYSEGYSRAPINESSTARLLGRRPVSRNNWVTKLNSKETDRRVCTIPQG